MVSSMKSPPPVSSITPLTTRVKPSASTEEPRGGVPVRMQGSFDLPTRRSTRASSACTGNQAESTALGHRSVQGNEREPQDQAGDAVERA